MIRALDVRTFEHMRAAQQRYMVAVAALEDFSTRDYAYDVGGWQASSFTYRAARLSSTVPFC